MTQVIGPGYQIKDGQLVDASGVPIPADVPLFVLRADDLAGLKALEEYARSGSIGGKAALTDGQLAGAHAMLGFFYRYRADHPAPETPRRQRMPLVNVT